MSVDKIREFMRESEIIRQVFILSGELSGDGGLIYPSEKMPISSRERDFLLRTKEIGLSRGSFTAAGKQEYSAARPVPGEYGNGATAGDGWGVHSHGWRTWYLGDGINFMFWRLAAGRNGGRGDGGSAAGGGTADGSGGAGQPQQQQAESGAGGERKEPQQQEVAEGGPEPPQQPGITGFELNRMAVISGIIRTLPDTPLDGENEFRITLTDVNGRVIYQWGGYDSGETEKARAVALVTEPLNSWRLRYFAPSNAVDSAGTRNTVIVASVSFVTIAVIGLAVYLFRESRREAREALQKVTFVNQVSHELKTPLTNIRMYAELLEEQLPEDEEKPRSYLDVVVSESRRLSRLIGNVLTFGKDRKTGVTINPAPTVPDEVVTSVVESFSPSLKVKGIGVELKLHCGSKLAIDSDVFEQILSNLISNVEKYAASGGSLLVQTACESGAVKLTVRDRGPGIPQALRDKVFKPFFRVSNKLTDGVTGTGIGLSIVRMLAELHGGSARLLPSKEGAAFQVVLKGEAV
jgi:signal transduction histidine kinase